MQVFRAPRDKIALGERQPSGTVPSPTALPTVARSVQWRLRYVESLRNPSDHDSRAFGSEEIEKGSCHRSSMRLDSHQPAESGRPCHHHAASDNEPVAPSMQRFFDGRQSQESWNGPQTVYVRRIFLRKHFLTSENGIVGAFGPWASRR